MFLVKWRFWKKLGLSLATLAILFACAELYARLAEPGPFTFFDRNPYLEHPVMRHVHRPSFRGHWEGSWFETNSLGMRGPEVPVEKPPGEYRVITLGDSCTFGKSVLEEDTWPRQLEALLAAVAPAGLAPRVCNLGVNGFAGSDYHGMFFELGLRLDPDLVLIGFNLNDFPNVIEAVDQAVYKRRTARQLIPKWARDWMGRTALYRLIRAQYYEMNLERDWANAERIAEETAAAGQDPEVWQEQERILGEIVEAARDCGAEVAVFLFPYESQVYLETFDATPIELLKGLCETHAVPFVDLTERFRAVAHETDPPRRLFVRGDRYHPTGEGYAIVARSVLEVVRDEGWLAAE